MIKFERNYPKALYWLAAGLITTSVLWGMKIDTYNMERERGRYDSRPNER